MKRTAIIPTLATAGGLLLILLQPISFAAEVVTEAQTIGSIERADPTINEIIPEDAEIEVLAKGFDWSEGPVWVKEGGYLLFSDIPPNTVYKWQEGEELSVYLRPSGYTGDEERSGEPGSNGLAINAQNELILCQHGDRRIAKMLAPLSTPKPEYETLVGRYEGKRLNSPNDLVIHSNGDIYFTDPPYGLEGNVNDPTKALDFQGVYLLRKNGEIVLLTKELSRPNGIALSPNEKTLYVANSDNRNPVWMAYPLKDDGTIGEGEVFFDSGYIKKRLIVKRGGDGMKVDRQGNIFATGPGGVLVLSPQGKYLGRILTENATANCAFGDDGQTLYITADAYLLRVRLNTKGLGF